MLKMVTKQSIIHWHLAGMSQREISREAKVSRRTVQKVLAEYEQVRRTGDEDALEDLLMISETRAKSKSHAFNCGRHAETSIISSRRSNGSPYFFKRFLRR